MFAKSFLYLRTHEFKVIGMNEKKALMTFVSLLLAVALVLTLATPVAKGSPERIVGVKVGDWAKYGNFLATWKSNDPNAQRPPLDLVEHNNTEWTTNTVTIISGTRITFQTIIHYKNGTETSRFSDIDINTGDGNGLFAFISANLNPFESVYNSTDFSDTWINETIGLVYVNALRETNYLKATTTQYVPSEIEQNLVYNVEYFWDKAVGILAERSGTFVNATGSYQTVAMRSEVMINTNIWQPNPDSTPPTAKAGPDQTAIVDQIVNFDAENSSDNEGGWGIASYEWDFGDGAQGTGIETTHAFKAPRKYTVTLTVKDWAGNTDTDTLTVTVQAASSPSFSTMGVAILVMLLIAGLFFWIRRSRK